MELKPGYKQTDIGVIPEEWEVNTVGLSYDICNQLRLPISQSVREKMSGPYPYYGPTGIQGWINEFRIEGCYALIGEDGDHFLKWQYQPMTLLVNGKFNVNNHAHIIQGRKNATEWFYWYFSCRDLSVYLTRQGAGRFKLTKAALLNIPCPLPPLPEQHAIAAALSDIDALLAKLDQLLAKKRDIKQGAMQELLTGKRRLPGFVGEWEEKQLGELATIDPENLGSGTSKDYEFNYISLEDVDVGVLRSFSSQVFLTAPSRARRILRKGDVLVSTVRPNLQSHLCFMTDAPHWVCSTGFAVVRCHKGEALPGYVFAHLFTYGISKQIDMLLTGSNYPAINSADVRALQIPLPSLPEQEAITSVLSEMDAEIAAIEAQREKMQAIKLGMMQELLTGRIRLV